MSVPLIRHNTLLRKAARIAALQRASDIAGQEKLAAGMGVAPRTLRSYLSVERSLPTSALTGAASALRRLATEMLQQADVLDGVVQ